MERGKYGSYQSITDGLKISAIYSYLDEDGGHFEAVGKFSIS